MAHIIYRLFLIYIVKSIKGRFGADVSQFWFDRSHEKRLKKVGRLEKHWVEEVQEQAQHTCFWKQSPQFGTWKCTLKLFSRNNKFEWEILTIRLRQASVRPSTQTEPKYPWEVLWTDIHWRYSSGYFNIRESGRGKLRNDWRWRKKDQEI